MLRRGRDALSEHHEDARGIHVRAPFHFVSMDAKA
jgi:hypothetical protein